jgi:hypothetical protein
MQNGAKRIAGSHAVKSGGNRQIFRWQDPERQGKTGAERRAQRQIKARRLLTEQEKSGKQAES